MNTETRPERPEECVHADVHFANAVIDDLPLCGCGRHDAILAEIGNVLRSAKPPYYLVEWEPPAEFGSLGGELLLHAMSSRADLLEHGGSVYGSWLTERGQRFLSLLDAHPDDPDFDWLDYNGLACSECPGWGVGQ